MNKGRLESFSDGVFAVAITLLVLDLHASASRPESLAVQLVREWPSFAAYVLSFLVIGIIWVNHHAMLTLAARVDRALMFYNLLLLLWVATIPFTTATLAAYLRTGGTDTRVAVLLYGLSLEGMAVAFTRPVPACAVERSHGHRTAPLEPQPSSTVSWPSCRPDRQETS